MLKHKAILFYFTATLILNSCASSAQMGGVKIVEENQEKKYTQIKTVTFKSDATILKDTINEFNKYPPSQAIKQYIPSLIDIQVFESVLKNKYISGEQITNENTGEIIVKHYKKSNRQYSGYIDKSGDTVLVVCFLDFSNKKKSKEFFNNWKYQNGYLGSALFLDGSPPPIYCYALNVRTRDVIRYKV